MENNISELSKVFEPELLTELMKLPVNSFEKGFKFPGNAEDPNAVPIVIKGHINVSKEDSKGRSFPVYTINEGESCIIALNAIIHSSKNRNQVGIAGEDVETVMVSAEQSTVWIDKYKSWRKYIFDLYGKRLNELLTQHEVVTEQKDQITTKNEKINSSIKYARRIQNAVMPSKEYISGIISDYFVLNKPKDIVSGDFYWVEQKKNKLIIVAADSTGHGVPGAFMSMLGISMLNEIVNKEKCTSAGMILTELRRKIKASLKQTGEKDEQKDGFDMALCLIDLETHKLEFAGAYNPLYLIRKGELMEIKADKMPVGIHIKEKESFTTHETNLQHNDHIYIFSDGFADQFGGEKNQKFKAKAFKKLLLNIQGETLDVQKTILSDTFENWKGKYEQMDDVLVFGMKIN